MLEQLGRLPVVLTSDSQFARVQGLSDHVIVVNEDVTKANLLEASLPVPGAQVRLQPDLPAYVIFTSGSTGSPTPAQNAR